MHKIFKAFPDTDNIYKVWCSPFFIYLPKDGAIDLNIQWMIFYQN